MLVVFLDELQVLCLGIKKVEQHIQRYNQQHQSKNTILQKCSSSVQRVKDYTTDYLPIALTNSLISSHAMLLISIQEYETKY